jgi:hypothetical protein
MAIGSVSPVGVQQFFDNNGDPLAGGKLLFYEAGTSTPTPAYADFNLTTPLANPVILDAGGRAPQLFLAALTYKQVLQDANNVTLWTADNIVTPTALRSTNVQTSVTGDIHNLPVPAGVISFIELSGAEEKRITGFAGGTPGQILIVRNHAGGIAYLYHNSPSAAPGNVIWNFVQSGSTPLVATANLLGGVAVYVYRSPGWLLVSHEQGPWIRQPFANLTFRGTDNAGATLGSWTVSEANVQQMDIRQMGASLLVTVAITETTVAGNPVYLEIAGWPYTFRTSVYYLPGVGNPGGATETIAVQHLANTSKITFVRGNLAPWPNQTGTLGIWAQFVLDVV